MYGFDESMLKCMDLEGEEVWRVRGLGHGALTIAGGRILTTTSQGELLVARADPGGLEELARRPVLEDGVFWTAPVRVDGRVLFRGSTGPLVCLDHRTGGADTADVAAATAEERRLAGLAPAEHVARHLAAAGLTDGRPEGLRFEGRLHDDSLGLSDRPAKWAIGAGGRWHCEFDLPPGFDVATGLLAGRTAPDEHTVVLVAWWELEGWRVPMHRTTFDPDTGEEERWRFTVVRAGPLDDALFAFPAGLGEDDEQSSAEAAGDDEDAGGG